MNYSYEVPQLPTNITEKGRNCKKNQKSFSNYHRCSHNKKSCMEKQQTIMNSYRWQASQHEKYVNFLAQKRDLFEMPLQKKIQCGIHKLMSKSIKNRSATQCRSHHQKMMVKYKTIQNIIFENFLLLIPSNQKLINKSNKEELERPTETERTEDQQVQSFFNLELFLPNIQPIYFQPILKQIDSYQYDDSHFVDLQ